jgi:hypothetical protein
VCSLSAADFSAESIPIRKEVSIVKYEKPRIMRLGTAVALVQSGGGKPFLPWSDNPGYHSIAAYEADE